jgi:hypothetical protein
MRLVYLSPVPWTSFAQRPQKFVEWFHRKTGGEVLWIEPYPTRFPLFSDFKRLRYKSEKRYQQDTTWLKYIQPRVIPIEPLPWSSVINAHLWRATLDAVDEFVLNKKTLLVFGKPSALALTLLSHLKGAVTIYDAMDDFPSFYKGFSKRAMAGRESELASRVDYILASSSLLKQRWSAIRSNVRLVRNGLDLDMINNSISFERLNGSQKVFGYLGTIGPWFDWEWVDNLATIRKSDIIRLIGPVCTPLPAHLPINIVIEPPCGHQEGMRKLYGFDVGIIPFVKNDLTASVDPIKFYEYKAAGLPVISTDFGEMSFREFDSGVFLSRGKDDISFLSDCALKYKYSFQEIQRFIIANSWDARFDQAEIIKMESKVEIN